MLRTENPRGADMQRQFAKPWIWADPTVADAPYAAVCLKNGSTYAGPADCIIPFTQELTNGADMMVCPRAEALRYAIRGSLEG